MQRIHIAEPSYIAFSQCMNNAINDYQHPSCTAPSQLGVAIGTMPQMNNQMNMVPVCDQQYLYNGNISTVHSIACHGAQPQNQMIAPHHIGISALNGNAMSAQQQLLPHDDHQQCSDDLYISTSPTPSSPSSCNQEPLHLLSNHKYMVIFDWDDTVFPTASFVRKYEKVDMYRYEKLGKMVYLLLNMVIEKYSEQNIFIVTNGVYGWVERSVDGMIRNQYPLTSGKGYWSGIRHLLMTKFHGRIHSARFHEKQYPKDPSIWKTLVFQQIANHHFDDIIKYKKGDCSIIAVGDSDDEMIASLQIKNWLLSECGVPSAHLVRLQLKRLPPIDSMITQCSALRAIFGSINFNGKPISSQRYMYLPALIDSVIKKGNLKMADQSTFVPQQPSI